MIVSLIEYPNIVNIAAMNGVSTSYPNNAITPKAAVTSCNSVKIPAIANLNSYLIVMYKTINNPPIVRA